MRFQFQPFLRAMILAGFAIFFIQLHLTGDITKYINPKYDMMSKWAAGILVILFFIQLPRIWEKHDHHHEHCHSGCTHDHGYSGSLSKKLISYSIIIFPLITGFTLSPTVLDSSIAAKKGTVLTQGNKKNVDQTSEINEGQDETDIGNSSSINSNDQLSNEENIQHQAPVTNENYFTQEDYDQEMEKLAQLDVIEMKNDIFASYYETISIDPKAFVGKKIKVSGFVYKEEGFTSNQLVISRFLITHCLADASIIGFLTEMEQAGDIKQDTWLEIEGTLDVTTYNGIELPMIKTSKWKVIEKPAEPYVYPVLINLTE
ncbi:MAG: TIGR03943 family protein [Bacillus sp. (in: Bacteria)]|nr:TIGR03943 family protein [Bacillus sp. (in: firmicutes)]